MNTFARRLNSLLSLARGSWNEHRKGTARRRRPAASARTRLSLEALEDRMLLSGNPPGYTLTNGNLYNTAVSQSQPIDTGVQSFAVVNNTVYDLHSNNTLHSLNSNGTGNVSFAASVQSFAVGGDGLVYYLDTSNNLWQELAAGTATSNAQFKVINSHVQSFAAGGDGHVYFLDTSNDLCQELAPATATSNAAYTVINSHVQSFAAGGDGHVYFLDTSNDLCQELAPATATSNAAYTVINSHVQSFAIAGNGLVVELATNGDVWEQSAPGSYYFGTGPIGWGVQSLAIAGNGLVVELATNGDVWEQSAPGSYYFGTGPIGWGVQSLAIAGNGLVVELATNGDVWEQSAPGSYYFGTGPIGWGVQSFAIAGNGLVVELATNGDLWEQSAPGSYSFGTGPIGTNVQSFAIGGNGTIYAIRTDGSLWGMSGLFGSSWEHLLDDVHLLAAQPNDSMMVQFGSGLSASLNVGIDPSSGSITLSLNNMQLNVGALAQDVLDPIISAVQKVTEPLEPVAQFLADPIPVLSSIDNGLTVANLLGEPSIQTAADAILAINSFNLPAANEVINLGSVTCLDTNPSAELPLSITSSTLTNFAPQVTSALAGFEQQVNQIGLDFPVLDNPSMLIQLATGHNVPLFTYTMPSVDVPLQGDYTLAVIPIPPIAVLTLQAQLEGSFDLEGTFGCDSSGLLGGQLLNSFFVQNLTVEFDINPSLVGGLNVADVAGPNVSGGLDAQVNLTMQGAGGSTMITGSDLMNGTVSVAISGTLSATADVSVWVGIGGIFTVTVWSHEWNYPIVNF